MPNYNNYPYPPMYGPANTYTGYNQQSFGAQQPAYYEPQPMNSIVWVQGEAGANAYPVAKGQTVMLMDSNPNSNMFYLKSADPYTGRPLPLEKYHYSKVVESQNEQISSFGSNANQTNASYVPREEFDILKTQLEKLQKTLDDLTK